jgi:hypothetical protein
MNVVFPALVTLHDLKHAISPLMAKRRYVQRREREIL